jgi:hypothetical protein
MVNRLDSICKFYNGFWGLATIRSVRILFFLLYYGKAGLGRSWIELEGVRDEGTGMGLFVC